MNIGAAARQSGVSAKMIRYYEQVRRDLQQMKNTPHGRDEDFLRMIGGSLDRAHDSDMLNAPPPGHPLFAAVVDALIERSNRKPENEQLLEVATAAKTLDRQHDAVVERAHLRLIELAPVVGHHQYNWGLWCKTPGRFRDGMVANQQAARLGQAEDEATRWNLGICATGCRIAGFPERAASEERQLKLIMQR